MGVPNKTSTSNRSLGILVTIPNHCGWNLPIRRRGSIFRAERISQLRTLSRSVNSRTLRKISSLSTILKIALFQSVSTIYSHTCRSEQRSFKKLTALRCLKALVLWSQSDKVHSQLRSLYRSVYQSRSVFGHLWIPPQGTWTSPPAVYYCFLRVACSVLLFCRNIIPRFFHCWFSFRLGRTQLKTDQVHVEDQALNQARAFGAFTSPRNFQNIA